MRYYLAALLVSLLLYGFNLAVKPKMCWIAISGVAYDYKTHKVAERKKIYAYLRKWDEARDEFYFEESDYNITGKTITDRKGRFCFWALIESEGFWLVVPGYAHTKIVDIDTVNLHSGDTLQVGKQWLIPYDNELHNEFPESDNECPEKKSYRTDVSKPSIKDVVSAVETDTSLKRVFISSLDTVCVVYSINYGSGVPGGRNKQSYKTLKLKMSLKK